MTLKTKIAVASAAFLLSLLIVPAYSAYAGDNVQPESGTVNTGGDHSGLAALLRRLGEKTADIKSIQTDFVQVKDLAIFRQKIVLKGRIYLQKPYRIAWHVDEPLKYRVLITDRFIRQWDEDTKEVQELSASGNTVFQNIIDQLGIWFSGNYVNLLDDYDVQIRQRVPMVIEFVPRAQSMAKKVLSSITVTFREDERYIRQIAFQEVSGDRTVITLENTLLNPLLDERHFIVDPEQKHMSGPAIRSSRTLLYAVQDGEGAG